MAARGAGVNSTASKARCSTINGEHRSQTGRREARGAGIHRAPGLVRLVWLTVLMERTPRTIMRSARGPEPRVMDLQGMATSAGSGPLGFPDRRDLRLPDGAHFAELGPPPGLAGLLVVL